MFSITVYVILFPDINFIALLIDLHEHLLWPDAPSHMKEIEAVVQTALQSLLWWSGSLRLSNNFQLSPQITMHLCATMDH